MPGVDPKKARAAMLSFQGATGGLTDAEKAEKERLRKELEAQIATNKAAARGQ